MQEHNSGRSFALTAGQNPGSSKPDPILIADNIVRQFGGLTAVNVEHLEIQRGSITALIGPNGAGKSTVLQIMAGIQQPSNGEAYLSPGYTVGILLQEPPLNEDKNVLENVQEGVAETIGLLNRFNAISEEMANPEADYDKLLAEMGTLQEQLDHRNAWDLDSQLEQAMDALRCPPPEADVKVLSGGERRRVALCKLLLQKPFYQRLLQDSFCVVYQRIYL